MSDENELRMSKDELRDAFMHHVRDMVWYWSRQDERSEFRKLSGLAFSILSAIDGTSMGLPAFDLVARPHPDNKQYRIDQGEQWIEDGMCINDDVMLHEEFYDQRMRDGDGDGEVV